MPDRITKGFTLVELLIVIAIIGTLSAVVMPALSTARSKAYAARARAEFRSMAAALQMYQSDHGGEYPADASRDMPAGLEAYLSASELELWPKAPWPGSVYDWDNWTDPETGEKIYQISIRFCPAGGTIDECRFPSESWAEDFDRNSSFYYCISGACRAHIDEPVEYPGYCVNCQD